MKTFWTIQIGIGALAIAGLAAFGVACGSSSSTTDTGTDTGVGGGDTGTDTDTDTDTDTTSTDTGSCMTCACDTLMSAGGCEDLCKSGTNGTTNPNFCDGSTALSQCATCIANSCGESDPTSCN